MRFWAAAGLLFLFTYQSQAEVRSIQAGDVDGLIQAVLDANANPEEWMVVVVKGTGTFEFTDDYQDSGFALPPLEGARLAILIEKADVTFFLNPTVPAGKSDDPPSQSFGFFSDEFEPDSGEFVGVVVVGWFLGNLDLFGFFSRPEKPKITQSSSATGPAIQLDNSGLVIDGIRIEAPIEAGQFTVVLSRSDTDDAITLASRDGSIITFPFDSLQEEIGSSELIRDKASVLAQLRELDALADKANVVLADVHLSRRGAVLSSQGPNGILVKESLLEHLSGITTGIRIDDLDGSASGGCGGGGTFTDAPCGTMRIENSVIVHADRGNAVEFHEGRLELHGVTFAAEDAIDVEKGGVVEVYRSILGTPAGDGFGSDREDNCEIEFPSRLESLGYNLSADDSCPFTEPTDRINANPRITPPADGELVPGLAGNSPAIDGGPSGLINGELPCGTTDVLGMARPQDGDGDGTAACDVGALEIASRGSIDGRQSGAYYDVSRNGEGVFVEMLSPTSALVYLFSYTPDGDPFWALGVGQVVGNGIVIRKQDFLTTRGAVFGEGFNPADVEFIPFADISINFPDCRNTTKKGSLSITPNDELGFGPVLSTTERLTFILDCGTRAPKGPGFSGSFFDPSHDGEGIIVQVISAETVVVQWFTYDAEGNQYWIQGVGTLSGGKVTVDEALAFRGPRYGPNYDAGDLEIISWGTIAIEFDGCDAATLSYDSVIDGFGSGMQDLQRLSSLRGVECS